MTVDVTFIEPVSGLSIEDFEFDVTKGSLTSLTGSGTTYQVIYTPFEDQEVASISIGLLNSAVTDPAGNDNDTGGDPVADSGSVDTRRPTLADEGFELVQGDSSGAGAVANQGTNKVLFYVAASEAIDGGLIASNFSVTNGTSRATPTSAC